MNSQKRVALELKCVGVLVNLPAAIRNGESQHGALLLASHRHGVGMVLLKPQHSHAVVPHSGPKTSIVPKLPLLSVVLLTSYHNQNAFVHCCLVKEGCFHVGEILQIEKILQSSLPLTGYF